MAGENHHDNIVRLMIGACQSDNQERQGGVTRRGDNRSDKKHNFYIYNFFIPPLPGALRQGMMQGQKEKKAPARCFPFLEFM